MPDWTDVVARARGLGCRLLGRARLVEAAGSRTLEELAHRLDEDGFGSPPLAAQTDPEMFEVHVRRTDAARLALLSRWAGDRTALLASTYEDQDRINLRAILRGVMAGVPTRMRLTGLTPTPSLSEAALNELARLETPAQIAALLSAWGHRYGHAILAEAAKPQPDPFKLQLALDAEYAKRALASASRVGRVMLRQVRLEVDLENAWTAMAIAAAETKVVADELFLAGGSALPRDVFRQAARGPDAPSARRRLATMTAGSVLGRILAVDAPLARLEDEALRESLHVLEAEVRAEPLGIAVVLRYAMRLRAEVRDLARIVWGVTMAAPTPELIRGLVTP